MAILTLLDRLPFCTQAGLASGMLIWVSSLIKGSASRNQDEKLQPPRVTKTFSASSPHVADLWALMSKSVAVTERVSQGKCLTYPETCLSLKTNFLSGVVYLLLVCFSNRAVKILLCKSLLNY